MECPWPEMSFVVILINLNEGYEGGSTAFYDNNLPNGNWHNVAETGRALCFEHEAWMHEGIPMISGVKYLLSLNVMYKLVP